MKYIISLIIKEEPTYLIFINELKAYKNDICVKEKIEKDFIKKEEFSERIKSIYDLFKNKKNELIINSNNENYFEIIKSIFQTNINLISDEIYSDIILEIRNSVESEHKVEHLPKFIYQIEKKDFEKNLLLFMIINYFDNNPSEIFDFPLFLEMKNNKEIDVDICVEDFVEDLLERFQKLGV